MTRNLCHEEFGVEFRRVGELLAFLDRPGLYLVLSARALRHLWCLLNLSFGAVHRPLVELLLLNAGAYCDTEQDDPIVNPLLSACLSRGDDCEMVQLFLCSEAEAVDLFDLARRLDDSIYDTGSLGPAELLVTAVFAPLCATLPFWDEDNPLCDLLLSDFADLVLRAIEVPDELLCSAMVSPAIDSSSKIREYLMFNCEDLPRSVCSAMAPRMSQLVHGECDSSFIRELAQCGLDLDPLLSDGDTESSSVSWGGIVASNVDSSHITNDTATIFWPIGEMPDRSGGTVL